MPLLMLAWCSAQPQVSFAETWPLALTLSQQLVLHSIGLEHVEEPVELIG